MPRTAATELGADRPREGGRPAGRILITPATEHQLRSERDRLRHELDVVFAARMREARSTGDGAAGDDHLQIREEEMVVRAEVARIDALLASAVVVDEPDNADGRAGIGSVVEVRDVDSGAAYRHVITGDFDRGGADDAEVRPVSASSPVGQALLGRGAGEEAVVELPDGRRRRFEVVTVSAIEVPDSGEENVTARPARA